MAVNYKGFRVLVGVKWTETKDSITITCYPKKSSVTYKLHTKSWKNYCPTCKKSGHMVGFGQGTLSNGRKKFGVEGGVVCLKCDADFCGVTGRDTKIGSNRKLTPASSISSSTSSSSSIQAAKCEISNAEALARAKKQLEESSKSNFKGTITTPMLSKLKPSQYCELDLKRFTDDRQNQYWIDNVKININNQTMTAELLESMSKPSMEYKKSDENNVTGVSSSIGVKASTGIESTIMLKGKELGSINNIFNWLRARGSGGWVYSFYYDHWQNKGSAYQKDTAAMKTCWEKKKANCTDFAWIFYVMCLGIGVKVNILHGTARFASGRTYGHLWNRYSGKYYDASSNSATNYVLKKVVV